MSDFWTEGLESRRKSQFKKLSIMIILGLILLAIVVLIVVYMNSSQYRIWYDNHISKKEISQEKAKTIEIDSNENMQIYAYDRYICILRKKQLEIYNKTGIKVSTIEVDINTAVFTSAGKYMAMCEENGHRFYLICGKEKLFDSEVEGNINQINVSEYGNVSVVLSNSSYKSIVGIYNTKGEEIFRTNLVTSRVIDVAISQNGKYLAIAEVDISGIVIKSSIQIVSIELAKTNPAEAILYKYEAGTDKLILNIEYQKGDILVCMYNNSIERLKDKTSLEIMKTEEERATFMTINLADKIGILKEISTGEYTSKTNITLINPTTTKKKEYIVKDVAKSLSTYKDKLAINFGSELYVFNTKGFLVKKYISNTEINDIVMSDKIIGVIYKDCIKIIKL